MLIAARRTSARSTGGARTADRGWTLPAATVAGAAAIGLAWFAVLLLRRADGLATFAYDQAFFQQVVWHFIHGEGFRSSFSEGSFLGLHFSPLLALAAGPQLLWADPRALSILHATALALAAPAAFLFLRAALRPARSAGWLAAALGAPIPFWVVIQNAARADFHTESLALPLALLAGWAGLSRRPWLLWTLALLALLAKEDQGYTLATIGLFLAVRASPAAMRRQGAVLAAVGIAWLPLTVGIAMPLLRGGAEGDTASYFNWLFTQPDLGSIASALTRPDGWLAALGIIVSLAGLPLLAPRWLLLVLPPLLASVLSRHEPQPALSLHYGLLLIVPLVIAAAMGARRGLAWARRRRVAAGLWPLAGAPAMGLGLLLGSLPPGLRAEAAAFDRPPAIDRLRVFEQLLPPDALLAADDPIAARLASRLRLAILPGSADPDAYLLVDRDAYLPGYIDRNARAALLARLADGGRRLLARDGRFELWSPIGD